MNRTILYYPTIDIPRSGWLRHALLYWDEVSSIVPKSWHEDFLVELSPEIHYLMDEGQFRPIKPEDLIMKQDNWEAFQQFQNEFIEIVSSEKFQNFIEKRRFSNFSRIHKNKVDQKELTSRIHNNKTSDSVYYFLENLGLAVKHPDYEWIYFEQNCALLYMSLLAKYLADIDSNQTTIGTDLVSYEKFNFQRVSKDKGFPVVSLDLNRVLPTPKDNIPFEKIIKFKRDRSDNLRHFKKNLSDFQTKIANSKSQGELKEASINFQESLINGVNDLSAVLKDSKIDSTLKTFKSLINLKSPTTLLTVGALINSKIDKISLPLDWTVIGIAGVGLLELTSNYIDTRNKERLKLRESPFSYIHNAHRYGLINLPK